MSAWRRSAAALAVVVVLLLIGAPLTARPLRVVTVASGLDHPWSLAFLPDGRMLVTERPGRMRIVGPQGQLGAPLQGLPRIEVRGQGGLLDVVLDPQFARNRLVYFSFAEAASDGSRANGTAVARGRLDEDRLSDVAVIFRQQPKVDSPHHFGSRLVFARDGRLFVTLGERDVRRPDAQALGNDLGKIVRIESDGRVPADNPLVGRPDASPEIWSWGHRNVQGAALNPRTGALWTHEHGPRGGDEVNIVAAGRNYGWPVITYGHEYEDNAPIGEGTTRADVVSPIKVWIPSIAPSGMAFLTSDRYPGWKGSLFVGALSGQMLVRLELDGDRVRREERLLRDLGERIRDVRQGPDGWLYLLTDNAAGRVIRLEN